MILDGVKLDELYQLYGFKRKSSQDVNVRVYTYRSGYFNNADIVPLSQDVNSDRDFNQYQKSGYACTVREYTKIEDASQQLFEGFFALDSTRKRFYAEEERFRDRQTELLGVDYKYIAAPYEDPYQLNKNSGQAPLIDRVIDQLSRKGPNLIILEAAAGFGKTCASFEILKSVLDVFPKKIPFLIELSRNRQAKIFRYVLLDEVDRVFPSLNADLVRTQIISGGVVLLIDGFDELLHRTQAISSDYDEVEPMLETISDLLKANAKIILTTRRTAIFSGDHFHKWIDTHENEFVISRYSLLKPNLEDWLDYEKRKILEDEEFPIHHLANPVLLGFLAGQSLDSFKSLASDSNALVERYFNRLLERETERQDLRMEPGEQYGVFVDLAKHMVADDFTAENNEYVGELIAADNAKLLSQVRNRYPVDSRPTLEELSAKLTSHALMDRKGEGSDRVGFINDFVLGTFVAESVVGGEVEEWVANENFVEHAVSAFAPRSDGNKRALWRKIGFALECMPVEKRVYADIALLGSVQRDLNGETINSIQIQNTEIGLTTIIRDSVFSGCVFTNVYFNLDGMVNVTFVGCRFFSCKYRTESIGIEYSIYLTGCSGDLAELMALLSPTSSDATVSYEDELLQCEKTVLEQFWPIGRPHFWRRKQIQTLYKGHSNDQRGLVTEAIDRLQEKGYIFIKADVAEMNTEMLAEIIKILGREH